MSRARKYRLTNEEVSLITDTLVLTGRPGALIDNGAGLKCTPTKAAIETAETLRRTLGVRGPGSGGWYASGDPSKLIGQRVTLDVFGPGTGDMMTIKSVVGQVDYDSATGFSVHLQNGQVITVKEKHINALLYNGYTLVYNND